TYAACYQVADWAVTPSLRLSVGATPSPQFPDVWVKNNFLHTPPGHELPPEYQDRYKGLKAAWESGASKERDNLKTMLNQAYDNYCADVFVKNGEPAGMQDFEDVVKILMLRDMNLLKFPSPEARGTGVVNIVYTQLRPQVEKASNFTIP